MNRVFALMACLAAFLPALPGLQPRPAEAGTKAPVIFNGETLFYVHAPLGPFSPADRAAAVEQKLHRLLRNPYGSPASITVQDGESSSEIVGADIVIGTFTDADAAAARQSRQELARASAVRIRTALERYRQERSSRGLIIGLLLALLSTALIAAIFRLFQIGFPRLYRTLQAWGGTRIPSLRIQRFELLPAERIAGALMLGAKALRLSLSVLLLYFYIPLVLSFFPWTRGYAPVLLDYVLSPAKVILGAIATYIPNLFFVLVAAIVTRLILKFVRLIFTELEKGSISFAGFYPEWAQPTYKITRFLILAFAVIAIYPYIPGSESPAFKGVSVFLGVLFSLGSAGAIANMVAGVVLTYMRAFQIGDRVRIADTTGDVLEKTLLVTRLRTIKNEDVTIPNSLVLGSHIVNYSACSQGAGLILHTSVTIGYDAPWQTVHALLVEAATGTEGILLNPAPFVLQTALNDFYVTYEINAYSSQPNRMANIYGELHRNIQDAFNRAGVEIMSPHYSALRDGNRIAIPDQYVREPYEAPAFRLFGLNKTGAGAAG